MLGRYGRREAPSLGTAMCDDPIAIDEMASLA
jgi:hypothetical protein